MEERAGTGLSAGGLVVLEQRKRMDESGMTERQVIGPRTVGEIATFVELLHAACEDKAINTALERLLSLPDENRRALVRRWVAELQVKDAPREFAEAIGCLVDDRVAEEAYEVIFRCRR